MSNLSCFFYVTFADGWEDTFMVEVTAPTIAMSQLLDDFVGYDAERFLLAATHGHIVKVELITSENDENRILAVEEVHEEES